MKDYFCFSKNIANLKNLHRPLHFKKIFFLITFKRKTLTSIEG